MGKANTVRCDKGETSSASVINCGGRVVRAHFGQQAGNALETGTVLALEDNVFRLQLGECAYLAKRAAGCLLEPEVGDKVLALREGCNAVYILNVLEKASGPGTLNFSDTLQIRAPEINMIGTSKLALHGAEVGIHGAKGSLSFDRLELCARTCVVQIKKVHVVLLSLAQRIARCFRSVGEERVRASRMDIQTAERWSLHAEDVDMVAKRDVKMDGEHIHLG